MPSILHNRNLEVAEKLNRFFGDVTFDIYRSYINPLFPERPKTINLLVNDICNSRCQMCSIWKMKKDHELTPFELSGILEDKLFKRVNYVGISGGEPTLRPDLPELYKILIAKLPKLKGTGIITNAINYSQTIESIEKVVDTCRANNISFNLMVSLDGIKEIHDKVRGRKGNFDSATEVLRHFKDKYAFPVSVGCTISKENVWFLDDFLDYCKDQKLYARFRVAEFINRLYNNEQTKYIRNFTDEEAYQIGLFFTKLELTYETSPTIKFTYRNIRNMIMDGEKRITPCPYQTSAVILDSRGFLAYCSPKSPRLGSCLALSANQLYFSQLKIRKNIVDNECSNCIHDYHSKENIGSWKAKLRKHYWMNFFSITNVRSPLFGYLPSLENFISSYTEIYDVLIIGWYGTETAGDKAILKQILTETKRTNPVARIVIASLNPFYTKKTIKEIGYDEINIISYYDSIFYRIASSATEVIMGGGPLLHIDELGFILGAFKLARINNHKTRIEGCGIGPLRKGSIFEDCVKKIISLTDVVKLRDSQSVDVARTWTGREDIILSEDPGSRYVRSWVQDKKHERHARGKDKYINLYLRELTEEYRGDFSKIEFSHKREMFEDALSKRIINICNSNCLRPRLLPMHHFVIGNDDRDFNRRFAKKYLAQLNPIVEYKPFSLENILDSFLDASYCVCMRFHSVVFAVELEIPFIAIDYTQGGKIMAYLRDHKQVEKAISLSELLNDVKPDVENF